MNKYGLECFPAAKLDFSILIIYIYIFFNEDWNWFFLKPSFFEITTYIQTSRAESWVQKNEWEVKKKKKKKTHFVNTGFGV